MPDSRAVADAIAGALGRAGTRSLFGVPGGGTNLDLIGACEARGIGFVLCHGEAAGAIMAATTAELSGVPGASVATRGPGAASAVNGVAHALLDRLPMVLVTDALALADRPRISHPRLDHASVFRDVTRASIAIGVDGAVETAERALAIAVGVPPGPVHLDVIVDAPRAVVQVPGAERAIARTAVEPVVERLAAARRPVVLVGGGARAHAAALSLLLAGTWIPALATYKAKGLLPPANDAGLLTGGTAERPLLEAADLIVAIGVDPVELIPAAWPYAATVVTIGEWPISEPYLGAALELVGPLDDALAGMQLDGSGWDVAPAAWKAGTLERIAVVVDGLDPRAVIRAVAEANPGALATVDAGAHMLVAMPHWPGRALISSGLATMGFALPAAIAAAHETGRRVVCLTGDGGLGMCLAELETAARLAVPVTVVVLNDAALSLIAIKQRSTGHGGPGAVRHRAVDFARVAEGFGIASSRAASLAAVERALADAPRTGPFLLDAVVDPSGYAAVLAGTRG